MSDSTKQNSAEGAFSANSGQQTFGTYVGDWWRRVRGGDLGSMPIIIGLLIIVLIFGTLKPVFFSPRNFVNLLLQMSAWIAIGIGIVFVLLIAEIDLSVGFVSGVGGVMMALMLRQKIPLAILEIDPDASKFSAFMEQFTAQAQSFLSGWSWPIAVIAALLTTSFIGLLHGIIITKAKVPSFVVTLAGLLTWSGVVLIMTTSLSTAGIISIQDPVIKGIANKFLPAFWGWTVYGTGLTLYALSLLIKYSSLKKENLAATPIAIVMMQILGLAALGGGAVWYANQDRGVPIAAVIIIVLLVFWSFIATRTRFGRYVYAVGGNPEAARRAGINVDRIRIAVFMISGFMSGIGGIYLASRLSSVSTNTGGGNLLLNSIAAAVIGGTSLFGGSGRVQSALLGALIITSVENGMGLLGLPSGVKFVVNGLVLLAAVLIDAFSRRSRESSGIA